MDWKINCVGVFMIIVCAWCESMIKDGEGEISHGICPTCEKKVNEDIDKGII